MKELALRQTTTAADAEAHAGGGDAATAARCHGGDRHVAANAATAESRDGRPAAPASD